MINTAKAIGNCQDEELVEEIFGSISEFARQIEENGDNFIYYNYEIHYDEETDIHWFFDFRIFAPDFF
jgi:hypothetical protein